MNDVPKPGSMVICTLHPEWGPGRCTMLSNKNDRAFVVWGLFGIMSNRKYETCKPSDLILAEST